MMSADSAFFPGFRVHRWKSGAIAIHAEIGGSGPALLLLHGYPQSHVAWHRVAPHLARHFTVVAADLRGYGDSVGPGGDSQHMNYCKRTVACDQVQLMQSLGFSKFAVMGHDRGARVAHRMCLDYPELIIGFVSLTMIPTLEMWKRADVALGMKAFHWYMFAQPFDLPERLLRADPAYFLDWSLSRAASHPEAITDSARAEYHRAFAKESVRHAMIEDYRAAASIDLEHDKEDLARGHRVRCPIQVLWSSSRTDQPSPVEIWQNWADHVEGVAVDSGHLMAEEAPDQVLEAVLPFLQRCVAVK